MRTTAHHRRSSARRAFTLAEVLVTLLLIGVILPVTTRGLSLAMSISSDARHRTVAAGLAEAKLNELAIGGLSTAGASGDFGLEHRGYRWTLHETPVNESMNELTIEVTWASRGRPQTLTLSTWVRQETGGLLP